MTATRTSALTAAGRRAVARRRLAAIRIAPADPQGAAVIADTVRSLTRSWPMRGTLHLLATEDVRWMCRLLNDPTNAGLRARWAGLEITGAVLDERRTSPDGSRSRSRSPVRP